MDISVCFLLVLDKQADEPAGARATVAATRLGLGSGFISK